MSRLLDALDEDPCVLANECGNTVENVTVCTGDGLCGEHFTEHLDTPCHVCAHDVADHEDLD